MKDTIDISPTVAEALSNYLNAGDFQNLETPERMAWIWFILRESPDTDNLFPRGKWATIQSIEGQLIEAAKGRQT